jgi:hypothetical protein
VREQLGGRPSFGDNATVGPSAVLAASRAGAGPCNIVRLPMQNFRQRANGVPDSDRHRTLSKSAIVPIRDDQLCSLRVRPMRVPERSPAADRRAQDTEAKSGRCVRNAKSMTCAGRAPPGVVVGAGSRVIAMAPTRSPARYSSPQQAIVRSALRPQPAKGPQVSAASREPVDVLASRTTAEERIGVRRRAPPPGARSFTCRVQRASDRPLDGAQGRSCRSRPGFQPRSSAIGALRRCRDAASRSNGRCL